MNDHTFTVGQKVLYRDWGWVAGEQGREWDINWREVEIIKINSVKFRIRFEGGEEQLAHVKNLKPLPVTTAIMPISERMTLRESTFRRIERTIWEYGQQLPNNLLEDFSNEELTILIPALMRCVGIEPGESKDTDKAASAGTIATFEIELQRKWLIDRQADMQRVHEQIEWLLKQFPPLEHSDFEMVEFYLRELQRLETMELWCYIYIQYLTKPRKMRDWSWLPTHQDRLQPHIDAMLKRLNVILDSCFRSTKSPETDLKAMMVGDEIRRWNPAAIVPAGECRTLVDVVWNAPNPALQPPQPLTEISELDEPQPNPHYFCAVCNCDLWKRLDRFNDLKNAPMMAFLANGSVICWDCSGEGDKTKLPMHPTNIQRGDKVAARETITFADKTFIPIGTLGRVETGREFSFNVKFKGHPHIVLCLQNMLAAPVTETQPNKPKQHQPTDKAPMASASMTKTIDVGKPIEPLHINCAECGQPVGLETVVFNKKTYCMDCGEPKLHEAQDETLFLQKLSDAPDEDTPAPRQIEQPPQPVIPMKQLSLFGDM
jgi:ribosomal protein L37E